MLTASLLAAAARKGLGNLIIPVTDKRQETRDIVSTAAKVSLIVTTK
jgi:hypothetical protein